MESTHFSGTLRSTSTDFRTFFLLLFTKELIRHSKGGEIIKLERMVKRREKKKKIVEKKIDDPYVVSMIHKNIPSSQRVVERPRPSRVFKPLPKPPVVARGTPLHSLKRARPVRIQEYPLPQRLQYVQPTPTSAQIDLGKLNGVLQDPQVSVIEVNGPDEFVLVKGPMGPKTTNITLSKEDVDSILHAFSEVSKIPLGEGVVKIVVGRYILSAIVSDIVGSKFIIRKMRQGRASPFGNFASRRY